MESHNFGVGGCCGGRLGGQTNNNPIILKMFCAFILIVVYLFGISTNMRDRGNKVGL